MRKFLGIILACLFSIILLSQVQHVLANEKEDEDFFHKPITNPITSPITGPLLITGKVTYLSLERFFEEIFHKIPAQGVTITVNDFFHHTVVVNTTTDKNGVYSATVPTAGLYKVTPSDASHTFFAPPFKIVPVNNAHSHATANFQGFNFF